MTCLIYIGCTANINDKIYNYLPLLLNPTRDSIEDAFIQPVDNLGTLSFKLKETVEISCPGGTITISNKTAGASTAIATCASGNKFSILGQSAILTDIACTKYPAHSAQYSGNTCYGDNKEILIGFQLGEEFLTQITVCFDPIQQAALVSTYILSYAISGYQVNYPRPDFIEGKDFYNLDGHKVNDLYSRNIQRETINGVLDLDANDYTYIHKTDDYYLARGHLTAKTDFIYGSQQRLTFYYVNVAPQWQTLNAGNWNTMEQNVRDYAFDRGLNLIVHTGTFGLSTLPNANTNEDVDIYLYFDDNGDGALPVPELFWKVIYDEINETGIAIVGINNPHETNIEDHIICEDVCDQVDWLTWKRDNIKQGYGYCCTIDEFRKTVPYLPEFNVQGLLV